MPSVFQIGSSTFTSPSVWRMFIRPIGMGQGKRCLLLTIRIAFSPLSISFVFIKCGDHSVHHSARIPCCSSTPWIVLPPGLHTASLQCRGWLPLPAPSGHCPAPSGRHIPGLLPGAVRGPRPVSQRLDHPDRPYQAGPQPDTHSWLHRSILRQRVQTACGCHAPAEFRLFGLGDGLRHNIGSYRHPQRRGGHDADHQSPPAICRIRAMEARCHGAQYKAVLPCSKYWLQRLQKLFHHLGLYRQKSAGSPLRPGGCLPCGRPAVRPGPVPWQRCGWPDRRCWGQQPADGPGR